MVVKHTTRKIRLANLRDSQNANLYRCSKLIKQIIQSQRFYMRWRRLPQYNLGSLFQRNPNMRLSTVKVISLGPTST